MRLHRMLDEVEKGGVSVNMAHPSSRQGKEQKSRERAPAPLRTAGLCGTIDQVRQFAKGGTP
jgi:hypothetical protein